MAGHGWPPWSGLPESEAAVAVVQVLEVQVLEDLAALGDLDVLEVQKEHMTYP